MAAKPPIFASLVDINEIESESNQVIAAIERCQSKAKLQAKNVW